MSDGTAVDFSTVTEVPGNRIRRQALSELELRYEYAAGLCANRDVLEVACGAGIGLGRLASAARRVVGADYSEELLALARRHYRSRVPLVRLDAGHLPIADGTFDVVILYEALYYLHAPDQFLQEARRVLRHDGTLLVCSTNVEWPGFNPSPFSVRYLSALERRTFLEGHGFRVAMFAAFPDDRQSAHDRVVSLVRRFAVACGLVPRTMAGKLWCLYCQFDSRRRGPAARHALTRARSSTGATAAIVCRVHVSA